MWDPEGGGEGPGEDPQPSYQEDKLKAHFQQQQDEIEKIKEFVKKDEENKMSTGKKAEKYAAQLTDIKSRSVAARQKSTPPIKDSPEVRTSSQEMETQLEEMSTPRRSKKPSGNLGFLREQVKENRAKFKQNKKGMEQVVHHLKNQLDERDVKILELQKHLGIQEGNISMEGEGAEQDLQAQIIHKDNIIIELNKKIADLKTKVLDLQESFSEKDSVIAARTKAITLMSEDFSRRSKITVDNLEETREEMRKMQSKFVLEEAKMKKEIEELKKEVAAKNQRLQQVEENNKDLLTVRFELSARNAELQEKVVKIHEKNLELQKEINGLEERVNARAEVKQDDTLVKQLQEANALKEGLQIQLDEANRQISKMKAQHKSKVRSLTKQLDGLKKMSDPNEEIVKLQNRIAELEEDKGNLQLHLVDFDELKVSESHCKMRILELEERISQQNQDLDTHVHMIALLEAEKLDHIKDIQQGREMVISLQEQIEKLKAASVELENQKLSLEMKTVDLEEQIDIIIKEKKELNEELEEKSKMISTEEKHVYEERSEKENLFDVSSSSQGIELLERDEQQGHELDESGFKIDRENLRRLDLEAELENSRKVIEEQKTIIMDLNFKIDSCDEELVLQRDIITKLEQLSDKEKEDKIMDIVKDLNEMASDLEEWKKRCTEVEKRLQDLGSEKDELEERFKEVKIENSTLKQQLEQQQELAADLASKLKDHSNAITNRDEKINSLQSMIELNGQTLEAREMTLKDVHEKLNTVEKQFESRLSELKSVLRDKEKEIMEMTSSLTKQDDVLKDRDKQIKDLTNELNRERQEFESLQQHVSYVETSARELQTQLNDMSRTAAEKDLLSSQMIQDCQHHKNQIEKLSSELSGKIEYINRIEMEMNTFRNIESQLKAAEGNVKSLDEELSKLKIDLNSTTSELGEKTDKLNEAAKKITELTEKNKKYIANLKARTVALKGQEQKLQQYEEVIKEKENIIVELTATNEKLLAEQTDTKQLDFNEVQNHTERIDNLTKELHEEQSRTELIGEELARATEKIVTLERELKNSEFKLQEMYTLEENYGTLLNKVSDQEREILQIKIELENKDEIVNSLKEENIMKIEQERELRLSLEEDRVKHDQLISSLEEKITILETELTTRKSELADVKNIISDKELRIDQLTEQMVEISEKGSQSLFASEAKLQEREAVVEFLEQEVSKSKETIQHLEERLASVEERRLSLEREAEALNLRALESDRIKEEVVETEGMLEKHFEMLLGSEESLKKRVGLLATENEELSQKIADLTEQNIEAKREIQNVECSVKDLLKEVERLTPFEFSFAQASEKIEALELELKRVTSEFEYRMNEKVHKLQQQSESLESDLKNVNLELEKIESEKRTLLERYEKLHDEKLNLEDEIERQNETITSYKLANENFKEKFSTEKDKDQRLQLLETEITNKTLILDGKEILIKEQSEKIQMLENEQKERAATIESLLSSKEELNEKLKQLQADLRDQEVSFEAVILEKDRLLVEMQEKVNCSESKDVGTTESTSVVESTSEYEELISQLNIKLENLRSVILQKDTEIKNYQTHMLQLQFDSAPPSSAVNVHLTATPDKILQLEEAISKLEVMIKAKEMQISDISSVLNVSNKELEELRNQHLEDKTKIETLNKELERLQEELLNKDNSFQQLHLTEIAKYETDISVLRNQYEPLLFTLKEQNEELCKELLQLKAQREISDIVNVAEDHVQKMSLTPVGNDLEEDSAKKKTVALQETKHSLGEHSEVLIHQENKIRDLEEELERIRAEKDEALLRLSQLTVHPLESMQSDETDNIILMIGSDSTHTDHASIIENEDSKKHELDSTIALQETPPATTSETVVAFGTQSWELTEEEGWWGSDEARLEEEHIHKQQQARSFSEPDMLNKRVIELEDHIKDLETEKEKLSEELHNSQLRSGKMLKKLKELKLKNDSLLKENLELAKKKSEKAFSDLDQAIEEELKIQIDTLEKEIKELTNERDAVFAEKDNLLKRIDVLTSANEKLVESKERQDIDLELWKQKNKDLSNKVQSLEWRIGELEVNNSVNFDTHDQKMEGNSFFSWDKQGLSSKSEDFLVNVNTDNLQEQAMSLPDENITALFEKEKSLRLSAESHIQDLQQRLIDVNVEIEQLATENAALKNQVEQLHQQQNVSYLQSAYNAVNEEYHRVATENIALKNQLEELNQQQVNSDLECTYNALNEEYNRLVTENIDLKNQLEQLIQQQASNNLENAYSALKEENNHIVTENVNLKKQLEQLYQQQKTSDLQGTYNELREKYDNLYKEAEEFKVTAEKKFETMKDEYCKKIDDLTNENLKIDEMCKYLERDQAMLSKELNEFNALNEKYSALQSDFNNLKEHTLMQEKVLAVADREKLRYEQELHNLKSFTERESTDDVAEMLSEQHIKIVQMEKELQMRIEELEKLRQLNEDQKLEHAGVEQEWNSKMERLRKELELSAESLLQQQNRYEMLEKEHEELKDHMNKVIENQVYEALSTKQQEIDSLRTELNQKESYFELEKEMFIENKMKENMKEIENMKHKLAESVDILNIRENDIKNLTAKVSEKEIELNEALSIKESDIQNLKIKMVDNERKLNELLGQKDQDIQNLKIQLSEKDIKINELEYSLEKEKIQCKELRKLLGSHETQSKHVEEIMSIKNIPISSLNIQEQDASTSVLEKKTSVHSLQDTSSDPQQELDLALYMLHQRDVRCDELTLELMQLLEERDTLQLRLSNALRMNEELRNLARTSTESSPVKIIMSQNTEKDFTSTSPEESPERTASSDLMQSTGTASVEVEEDFQSLANKLSELRRVGYHRDVTLQDEREQRHSEQVRLLHHRGSGIVVDANYTLSRDVQSPSTVLLNWIWGRSTPRVMHV